MEETPAHERADTDAWNRARRREAALRPLAALPSLSEAIVQDAIQQIGVSRSHFYRLLTAYKLKPQTSTLLPRRDGRARGAQHLPSETELLVHKRIEEFYMSRVRPAPRLLR